MPEKRLKHGCCSNVLLAILNRYLTSVTFCGNFYLPGDIAADWVKKSFLAVKKMVKIRGAFRTSISTSTMKLFRENSSQF